MPNLEAHLIAQSEESRRFFWHRLRWNAVRRSLPRGAFTLLDVGAGAGHLAEYLREERPQATYRFVEPIPALRDRLRTRHGIEADYGDHPRYTGVSHVALLDVLEHQRDDVGFLRNLLEKLDVGATVLLTVPALQFLWSTWDENLGHYRRYDRRELTRTITAAGFALETCTYLFPELLPLGIYRRFAKGRRAPDTALEFPHLPPILNAALYAAGRISQSMRRVHPAGTSLIAVARK